MASSVGAIANSAQRKCGETNRGGSTDQRLRAPREKRDQRDGRARGLRAAREWGKFARRRLPGGAGFRPAMTLARSSWLRLLPAVLPAAERSVKKQLAFLRVLAGIPPSPSLWRTRNPAPPNGRRLVFSPARI
jgi:hypothetical protein